MSSSHSSLLFRREDCVSCSGPAPTCNCAEDESCILTSRTCSACPAIQCVKSNSGGSKSGSVNPGAIAGPVVAVLVIGSLVLFWWLRRKKARDLARLEALAARTRKAESAGFHLASPSSPTRGHHDSARRSFPASVATGDGSVRVYSRDQGNINLDPKRQNSNGPGNPFTDRESVSTDRSDNALSFASSHSTNVIPIQYIPFAGQDEDAHDRSRNPAQTLDAARQNLLRLPNGVPSRPARSPDLDLRLKPSGPSRTVGESPSTSRESVLSGVSGTPSFLSGYSGATDFNMDAPRIVTSKQVHVGRLQQAEVVHFGQPRSGGMEVLGHGFPHSDSHRLSPVESVGDPFADARLHSQTGESGFLEPRNPNTNSSSTFGALPNGASYASGQASGVPSLRSLTPSSHRFPDEGEGGDLRFSMGSLAMGDRRDSTSTQGTQWSTGGQSAQVGAARVVQVGAPPSGPHRHMPRDSGFSARSAADSLLSSFPMIPPSDRPHINHNPSGIPQSTSVSTLDHAAISRPPAAFRSTKEPGTRPTTAHSVADSLLSSFPFIPPSSEHLADMPSSSAGTSKNGRHTMGMSMASEGLGAFDFKFDDSSEPPLPGRDARRPEDRESIDTMWVSDTVREHGVGNV